MTDDNPVLSERSESDLLLVGRVARAHGNRGQVIVNLDTDFAEDRFKAGAVLLVGEEARPRAIRDVRFHQGRPIVSLEGIDTMDDAEALAGAELKIEASALPPLPPATYYHHDLVGCEVRDEDGTPLGRVANVDGPMERSVLVVEGTGGELLIPLAADICTRIEVQARQIIVKLPEGLLELNKTRRT
jgi:16S rRNA processing protein RimM